jgi:predicted acetyltransferase
MAVEYRAPRDDAELEATFSCTAKAFAAHEEFWRSITRFDPWFRLENARACFVDGKPVSVVQIFERPIRVGSCVVKMGGVGSVGTDPDHRRLGYGTGTLRDSVDYMRRMGYDLSVLFTGVPGHYHKSGWVPYPTYRFQFEMPDDLIDSPADVSIEVCDPDRDLQGMRGIYDQFNASRTGTLVRSEAYWVNRRQWRYQHPDLLLAAKRDGNCSAYLAGGQWEIQELGYLPGEEPAMRALVHRFLSLARAEDVKEIQAPLPQVCKGLIDGFGGQVRRRENSGAMVRIINLQSLLTKVTPLLTERLRASTFSDWEGRIGVRYEADSAALCVEGGTVRLGQAGDRCDVDLVVSQAQLLRLVFGGIQADEVVFANRLDLGEAAVGLLNSLFPRDELFMWRTDGF